MNDKPTFEEVVSGLQAFYLNGEIQIGELAPLDNRIIREAHQRAVDEAVRAKLEGLKESSFETDTREWGRLDVVAVEVIDDAISATHKGEESE